MWIESREPLPTPQQLAAYAHQLSGESGEYRECQKTCQIRAANDYEAIQCWLREYQHKPTTLRSYRKEAERLLLWCLCEKHTALSSLTREDFDAYLRFLADPQPASQWCGRKGKPQRGDPDWRPFRGPLGPSARRTSLSIINSLFCYLHQAQYLSYNPLILMRNKARSSAVDTAHTAQKLERYLNPDEWGAIKATLDEWPENTEKDRFQKARARFLFKLLYLLLLRIDDVITTWQSFKKIDDLWCFICQGKGDRVAVLPVNNELLMEIMTYRMKLGASSLPLPGDNGYLITKFNTNQPLSQRRLFSIIKEVATLAAKRFPDRPDKAKKVASLSPHWIRHIAPSHARKKGISKDLISDMLRHSGVQTTDIYLHTELDQLHQAFSVLEW